MATILPSGQKIEHIQLISSWFESHRVLNPILTAANEYRIASKCRYVECNTTVIIVGPKDLANRYAVDEITILRAEQRVFIRSVKDAAKVIEIRNLGDFDSKMAVLLEIRPDQTVGIAALTEELRSNWCMAIAFDNKLDAIAPMLHEALEQIRRDILTKVVGLMLSSNQPWTELGHAQEIAERIVRQSFGKLYAELVPEVSSGETARLLGECPIGWETPKSSHG